ncbi:MAG: trigger factor [Bacteroidetes bacterium]|nr:trigger factor [Bacteroidota bacterium]
MEVSVNNVNDCVRELTVTMSQEELAPHFEKAYKEAVPTLEIKGFRKGKVPMHMIKKMFGASIEYQAVEEISNDVFRKEIESRNFHPIGTPQINKIDYKPGTPLTFMVTFEVRPEFELKDYKGITLERYSHKPNDTELQSEIERLQQINSYLEEAQKVENEFFVVTVDMKDMDENGHSREGMKIYLREKSTEKEIKEALQGTAVGDIKEVKFSHQHGDHSHGVHLQLSVKKIEKVILPAMDDALAQKVSNGKFQTAEELKQNIKKDLEEFWKERSDRRFENDLLSAIVKQYEFTVPEALIQNVTDTFIEDAKNQQPKKQLPKNFNEKAYREQARETALWQSKWLLIKEQFITTEKIEISDSEIEKIAEEESAKLNIDKERLVNFYKSSDNALERLKYNRLIDILKQNVKITDVETDDYSKFATN